MGFYDGHYWCFYLFRSFFKRLLGKCDRANFTLPWKWFRRACSGLRRPIDLRNDSRYFQLIANSFPNNLERLESRQLWSDMSSRKDIRWVLDYSQGNTAIRQQAHPSVSELKKLCNLKQSSTKIYKVLWTSWLNKCIPTVLSRSTIRPQQDLRCTFLPYANCWYQHCFSPL